MTEIARPTLEPLLAALSQDSGEDTGYPAGGAVAALVAALAAALAGAAADHSRDQWNEAPGARAQAEALRLRALALAHRNTAAYATAREALARRGSEDLGNAVRAAAEPPLALAAGAADIAELARLIAIHGTAEVRPDAVIAAVLAAAVARAAAGLVQVNLVVGGDRQLVAQAEHYAASAVAAADAARRAEV